MLVGQTAWVGRPVYWSVNQLGQVRRGDLVMKYFQLPFHPTTGSICQLLARGCALSTKPSQEKCG